MKITKRTLKHIIAEELKEAAQESPDLGYDPIADVFGVPQGDAEDFAAADRLRKGSTELPSGQETMSYEEIEDRMRAQAEDLGIDPEVYMAGLRKKMGGLNSAGRRIPWRAWDPDSPKRPIVSPQIKESKMKLTSQALKDLIKEELADREKPKYKGSASAASRLKKSIGSDEEPADEPAAKKEKSPLEKAKDRLERAKAKGDPARIKSAERAVKREKKKAGLPESVRRVSNPAQTQSVLGDEDLDTLDQELGTGRYEGESAYCSDESEEWNFKSGAQLTKEFLDWFLNSPEGDRARAAYEAEKAARGAEPPGRMPRMPRPRQLARESVRRVPKSTLYRIIKEELQNVMEQFSQDAQDMFDKLDDEDSESGESEEGGVRTTRTQTDLGNWKLKALAVAANGMSDGWDKHRAAFEKTIAPANPEDKAMLLGLYQNKDIKSIQKWALGQ